MLISSGHSRHLSGSVSVCLIDRLSVRPAFVRLLCLPPPRHLPLFPPFVSYLSTQLKTPIFSLNLSLSTKHKSYISSLFLSFCLYNSKTLFLPSVCLSVYIMQKPYSPPPLSLFVYTTQNPYFPLLSLFLSTKHKTLFPPSFSLSVYKPQNPISSLLALM